MITISWIEGNTPSHQQTETKVNEANLAKALLFAHTNYYDI